MFRLKIFRSKSQENKKKGEQGKEQSRNNGLRRESSKGSKTVASSSGSIAAASHATSERSASHKIRDEKAGSVPKEIKQEVTDFYIEQVRELVGVINRGDPSKMALYFTEDALFIPEDVPPIPIAQLVQFNKHLKNCFPDLNFAHKTISAGEKPHTVVVEDAQFSGTHTGAPYTPMPGKIEPVPVSNKFVIVDEERWFFEMAQDGSGKIKSFSVIALGPVTGPMGVYESLTSNF